MSGLCWFVVCGCLLFCVAFACCLLLLFQETPSVSFHSFSCVGMDNLYTWIDDRLSFEASSAYGTAQKKITLASAVDLRLFGPRVRDENQKSPHWACHRHLSMVGLLLVLVCQNRHHILSV